MMRFCLTAALVLCASTAHADRKTTKQTLDSGGQPRTYYLYVPDNPQQRPLPVLVLLHGSGRDGKSLVDPWQPLASKEGIILAGPDSRSGQGWGMRDDGPEFLRDLVETVKRVYPVDRNRIYLFGHSAGAIHALSMALLESEYFAAVAVHAGVVAQHAAPYMERATRKTPIRMWVGTKDKLFPLEPVRATRDALNNHGFNVELVEIKGHTHWYYDRAAKINKEVWSFLQQHQLGSESR
jgi:poly(3-hydroxybutyrate) depolymerase